MVHLVVGHAVPDAQGAELHIVRAVIEHGQRGVDVEEEEDGHGVRPGGVGGGQDGRPRAERPDQVLDGMLVARVQISPRGEVLPVMVLVNQRIRRRQVQDVMARGVAHIQHHEHHVQRRESVGPTNVVQGLGDCLRVPQVVTKALDEHPFVQRIDRQKQIRRAVEIDVTDRLARRPRRQRLGMEAAVDEEYDEVVVDGNGAADKDEAHQPLQRGEGPGIDPRWVVIEEGRYGANRAAVQQPRHSLLLGSSVRHFSRAECEAVRSRSSNLILVIF